MTAFGYMAAWPDPQDLPIQATWGMMDAEIERLPLARFRADAVERCHDWRAAAEADGWLIRPTYANEDILTAWTGERDGFKVQGIARPIGHHGSGLPVATLSIWGPDQLAIKPPAIYSMDAILIGSQTCHRCQAHPVQTERVAFAGRYCATCAPIERNVQERGNWCE